MVSQWLRNFCMAPSYFNDSILDIREQGFNEGLEKGEKIGEKIGEERGVRNVAKILLKSGMPVPDIMAATSLSAEQIESL